MEMPMIVEVGIKLNQPLCFYQEILQRAGAINTFNCETRDIYWTNSSFNGMTENEIKLSCIRYRMCKKQGCKHWDCEFQNYNIFDQSHNAQFACPYRKLRHYEKLFQQNGFIQVFDTRKIDYQYSIGKMKSRIQLQVIDDIGLVLYYDNPDYYHLTMEEQRLAIIKELNSYGFDFAYNVKGLDKLRTLFNGYDCFSWNQNC
jgi:hypothetical protein